MSDEHTEAAEMVYQHAKEALNELGADFESGSLGDQKIHEAKDALNAALLGYAAATFTDRAAKLEDFIGALQNIIDSSDVHPASDKIDILQKLIADGHGLIEELSGGAHDY